MNEPQKPGRTPVGVAGQDRADLLVEDLMAQQEARKVTQQAPPEGAPAGAPEGDEPKTPGNPMTARGFRAMKAGRAVVKGAARGLNEMGNTVLEASAGALNFVQFPEMVGALGGEEYEKDWEEWYAAGMHNPLNFNVGEREQGIYGLVEGAAQVATALIPIGKALKGLGLSGKALAVTTGAATDLAAFDPHEARLSDLLNDWNLIPETGPLSFLRPVTDALEADPEDTVWEGRMKNTLEGIMFSGTATAVVSAFRIKGAVKGLTHTTPARAEQTAAEAIQEALEKSPVELHIKGTDEFVVQPKEDALRALGDDVTVEPQTFTSRVEAERAAAEMELTLKLRAPAQVELDDATRTLVLDYAGEIVEAAQKGDEAAITKLLENDHFNFMRLKGKDETMAVFASLTEVLDEAFVSARNLSAGGWEKNLIRQSSRLLGDVPEEAFMGRLKQLAGVAEVLPKHLLAARMMMAGKAGRVSRMSRAFQTGADSPQLARLLSAELDEFANLSVALAGTTSNVARSLRQFGIHADEAIALTRNEGEAAKVAGGRKGATEAAEPGPRTVAHAADDKLPKNAKAASSEGLRRGLRQKIDKVWQWDVNDPWNTSWGRKGDAPGPFTALFLEGNLSARELQAIARTLESTNGNPALILRALHLVSDDALKAVHAQRLINEGEQAAEEFARMTRGQKINNSLLTFRAAAMLSGPRTHQTNLMGGAITFAYTSAERVMKGLILKDPHVMREGFERLIAPLADGGEILKDSIKWMRRSWQDGKPLLDPIATKWEAQQNLRALEASKTPLGSLYTRIAGLPFRALMSADQFMKNAIYLSETRAGSISGFYRENGLNAMRRLSPEDNVRLGERIYDDIFFSRDATGGAIREDALESARTSTFTNDFRPHSWQAALANFIETAPVLKHIMPFVKVPINITTFTARRTPFLWRASKQRQALLASADPKVRAQAHAQDAVGALVYSTAATMALQGYITGAGPKDPKLQKQLRDGGWRPYTMRIPGTDFEFSYRRLDPIATPLGLMADFVNYGGEFWDDEASFTEFSSSMLASMSASALDKSFFLGVTDAFEALGSGDGWRAQNFLENYSASYVPALAAQTNPDPMWREVDGIWDKMMSRSPLSGALEVRRNPFGEPMMKSVREVLAEQTLPGQVAGWMNQNFFMEVTDQDDRDRLTMALSALGTVLPKPEPEHRATGLNLREREKWDPSGDRQSPYDRWMELIQESGVRGQLEQMILSRGFTAESLQAVDGTALAVVDQLYRGQKEVAFQTMLSEYPALQAEMLQIQTEKRATKFDTSINQNILRTLNR